MKTPVETLRAPQACEKVFGVPLGVSPPQPGCEGGLIESFEDWAFRRSCKRITFSINNLNYCGIVNCRFSTLSELWKVRIYISERRRGVMYMRKIPILLVLWSSTVIVWRRIWNPFERIYRVIQD